LKRPRPTHGICREIDANALLDGILTFPAKTSAPTFGPRKEGDRPVRTALMLLLTAALVTAEPAFAGNKNKGKGNDDSGSEVTSLLTKAVVVGLITAAERAIIGDYLDRERTAFAGAQPLPPGIAKKVARGGALPPGIAKRTFPADLLIKLPKRPGQEWRVVGTDILIVDITSNVVVDIIKRAL